MHYGEAGAPRRRSVLRMAIALVIVCLLAIARFVTEDERREEALQADVKECILLFGAFCNGNMGDVVQPISMERLLSSVAPKEQCFYYAHARGEKFSKGFSVGKFFGGDRSRLIRLSERSAWKVNRFKALVIGGGGIFTARHAPLVYDMFQDAVTVPIAVVGVGAGPVATQSTTLLHKATFVSARDTSSIERLAGILGNTATPAVGPNDVRLVRDPVLSDGALTDTTGACWRQSTGDYQQPLCFVLPAANSVGTMNMHQQFREHVVLPGDRFINVFPKHQEELAQFQYPGTVEEILDPMEYIKQLCSCKAIVSTRFHGTILGLHMGVPTFGAFHAASGNKVPDLMVDAMSLPDQFFLIDGNLTREVVDRQVDAARRLYENEGRRSSIHDRLSVFHGAFQAEARRMLDAVGVARQLPEQQSVEFAEPALGVGDGAGRLPEGEKDDFNQTYTTLVGEDYVIAICLLFAIAELAFMPSTAAGGGVGGRGIRQRPFETAASVAKSFAQTGIDDRNGTNSTAERGIVPERSATAAFKPSLLRRIQLGARSASEPPNMLSALNFALWIALAVLFSSYSKSYLRDTHDPVGLLALQGVSGSVVLFLLGREGMGASDMSNPSVSASKTGGLPGLRTPLTTASPRETLAAVLHSGQAILSNFSLFVGGVAVTNALKAMEPVAAAVASYFLLGKRVAPGGVAALVIIVAGILLLTSKGAGGCGHPDAGGATDTGGGGQHTAGHILVSAAFSTVAVSCNALRNVVIKKGDPIPPHRTLLTCSMAAGIIGVTFMLLRLVVRRMDELLLGGENGVDGVVSGAAQYGSWLSMSGINAALCFVGYNLASFNLLARLSPVGHAVGNSVKRVVMFGSGIVLMGEVMSSRQLTGAAVALAGVGVYNVAGKHK